VPIKKRRAKKTPAVETNPADANVVGLPSDPAAMLLHEMMLWRFDLWPQRRSRAKK